VCGGLVFVSGQLAVDPATREPRKGPPQAQTRLALENLAAVLRAAGSDVDQVLKTTVYVSDITMWGQVNETYAEFFGAHRPARAIVPTGDLHRGLLVEIEAVAALSDSA
jgi:2-iminobutanoate/2-iminopropanoate deaminase